jgi:hypothetical protein
MANHEGRSGFAGMTGGRRFVTGGAQLSGGAKTPILRRKRFTVSQDGSARLYITGEAMDLYDPGTVILSKLSLASRLSGRK